MKRSKRLIIISGFFVILLTLPFITYRFWLPEVAKYLIVQDKLGHADVIVVLSGNGSRYRYAAKLFKEGYAKYVLLNYNEEDTYNVIGVKFDPQEMIKDFAVSNGIPAERILTEGRCTSTYEDILYAKENILKNQFKSAIIVSNNFHMRRVYLTFQKIFKEGKIKAIFIPVPMEISGINPNIWWTNEDDFLKVITEYIKLSFYYFKYRI